MIAHLQVPDSLSELDRWGQWRWEQGRKVPYRIDGRRADSTNPVDWGELARAQDALRTGRYSGLAFAFFESDGLVGIDLDDCLIDGVPKQIIQPMLEKFSDTYLEVSPSGEGLKLWCRGSLPSCLRVALADGIGLEIYTKGRYFAFTGRAFRGAPLEIADHAEDLRLLYDKYASRQFKSIPGGKIAHGTQHNRLVAIAGALRRHGVGDEAVEECLQIVNRVQCERPGPAINISRITRSTQKWLQ